MRKIGFIGIGVMGGYMVEHLINKGYELHIYNRTKSKALKVIEHGAIWHDTIADCVKDVDVVITIVGYPSDVKEVYLGEFGIINNVKSNTYLLDMTTSSPNLAKEIYQVAKAKQLNALDAPVTGGDTGAKNATLSIMVGGEKGHFEACLPILNTLGTKVVYQGKEGSGQHTKMANQIAIAGAISGMAESLTYAKNAGLNLETVFETVANGSAGSWQYTNMAPRVFKDDFAPGFYIKHFLKDMRLAIEEMEKRNVYLEMLNTVEKMYSELEKQKLDDLGTQGLVKYYENK